MTQAIHSPRRFARTLAVAAFAASALTVALGVSGGSAAQASAPQACVEQVMYGGLNWGGGTKWERHNAVALCWKARDYDERIACFSQRLMAGNHWQDAILRCQSVGLAKAAPVIRGYDVGMVRFDGGGFEQRGGAWIETGAQGQERFRFAETHRDEWSVYLHDRSRNLSLQLDLHRRQVMYEGAPLYHITAVDYAPQTHAPSPYTVEAGPIWNQNDARQKCQSLAASHNARWTGQWWTTEPGKMSVCQLMG